MNTQKPSFLNRHASLIAVFVFIAGGTVLSSIITQKQSSLAADLPVPAANAQDLDYYSTQALAITAPLLQASTPTCNNTGNFNMISSYQPNGSGTHTSNITELFSITNLHDATHTPHTVLVVYLKNGDPTVYIDDASAATILKTLNIGTGQFQTLCSF